MAIGSAFDLLLLDDFFEKLKSYERPQLVIQPWSKLPLRDRYFHSGWRIEEIW